MLRFGWSRFILHAHDLLGNECAAAEAKIHGHIVETAQWRNPRNTRFDVLQSEIDDLRTFLSDGDVAIDIAAQIDDTTLPMTLACGQSGWSEPNPFIFSVLASNAVLNPTKCNIIAFLMRLRQRMARRPSALSRQRCANGSMPSPIRLQITAPQSCRSGCIVTIGTVPTAT